MIRDLTGRMIPQSIQGRDYESFFPNELPPNPAIQWDAALIKSLTNATKGVSRLDGATKLIPHIELFLYSYVRKEAVLSSQIEGTQSSLSDLLLHENELVPGVPTDDVAEVSSYVKALDEGVRRIRKEPFSLELILDLHRILLTNGRGSNKDPGKLRETQNWIGGRTPDRAIFVPPPPDLVKPSLQSLIKFCNEADDNVLVKAALAHHQFETIHPFRDGNGRIGRLLITLLLSKDGLISEPLLYLSLYFKEHRQEYYEELQLVRTKGDWERWLTFFFRGIAAVTEAAFTLTQKIRDIFEKDQAFIRERGGRKTRGMLELYHALQQSPVLTITRASELLGNSISKPTLYAAAVELAKLGIISTRQNAQSVQVHCYEKYFDLLVT